MKFIGITCSIDQKKLYLNRDYINSIVRLGFIPLVISPDMIIPSTSAPDTKEIIASEAIIHALVEKISALIISGGGDINPEFYREKNIACKSLVPDKRVKAEIELLKIFIKTEKPVLGICYGMQLMNIFFGGTLYQNLETEINHTSNDHGIRVIDDFILNKGEFTVNSSHHQAIKSIGEGLEIFCMAKDGVIEGFYLKGHPFFVGVQWHPERHPGKASLVLWQSFSKKI